MGASPRLCFASCETRRSGWGKNLGQGRARRPGVGWWAPGLLAPHTNSPSRAASSSCHHWASDGAHNSSWPSFSSPLPFVVFQLLPHSVPCPTVRCVDLCSLFAGCYAPSPAACITERGSDLGSCRCRPIPALNGRVSYRLRLSSHSRLRHSRVQPPRQRAGIHIPPGPDRKVHWSFTASPHPCRSEVC